MVDMADEYIQLDPDVKEWRRSTVADGLWLNTNTVQPIKKHLKDLHDKKQDTLSAGNHISISSNVISVTGLDSEIDVTYPLIKEETSTGINLEIEDNTRTLNGSFSSTCIADPLSGKSIVAEDIKVQNNSISAHSYINNINLDVSYTLNASTWHPDFLYETKMTVTDSANNVVFEDYQTLDHKKTNNFSLSLPNKSPYKIKLSGDTSAFSGIDMNLSCYGLYFVE
jgi:hypothetical protein